MKENIMKGQTMKNLNNDTMSLDSRVKHENDNKDTMPNGFQIKSGMTRESITQSGRSMVEMLGTLAIIGVLSIGGIMGYSYGMDKYRANETINQIMLRAIDLMTQASNNNAELSLAGWSNETSQYDFANEDYTEDGLIAFDMGINNPLPKSVCEMVYDGMSSMAVQIDINAVRADSNDTCGDDNEMTFYFEGQIGTRCIPECAENEYCYNGICFKGGVPEMSKFYDECSSYDDDCGTCRWCGHHSSMGYMCQPKITGDCVIDGKDGLCRWGECYPTGCTTNADCKDQPNTYCASPNSSSTERFPSGTTGSCAPIDFVRYEGKDGNTYYISNTVISWWDAEFACDAIGGKKLLSVDDLVTESDGSKWQGDYYNHTETALAEELCDLSGYCDVWTQNLTDKKYAFLVNGGGNVSSSGRSTLYLAVCR